GSSVAARAREDARRVHAAFRRPDAGSLRRQRDARGGRVGDRAPLLPGAAIAARRLAVSTSPARVGRYTIHDRIGAGGMATVHIGRISGDKGFSRTVAIKRLYPQFAHDQDVVAMLVDEARLAARIRHPNVVPVLEVVVESDEVFLVLEYVHG